MGAPPTAEFTLSPAEYLRKSRFDVVVATVLEVVPGANGGAPTLKVRIDDVLRGARRAGDRTNVIADCFWLQGARREERRSEQEIAAEWSDRSSGRWVTPGEQWILLLRGNDPAKTPPHMHLCGSFTPERLAEIRAAL